MRIAYYAGVSTTAAAACLVKAFHERPNFYSATVYLSQSNACLLILTNYLLMLACGMVYGLQRLLYGPLRPIEIEHLSERAWYAVLDTLLAMPSFKEDVGGWLLTMFVLLLAGKVWGWIGEGRVDILEQQPPANPRLFHTRLANSLIFSVIFDIWMTRYCFSVVAADPRPGMMVIFTFEFAILTVFSTFTLCRYILSLVSIVITQQQITQAVAERKAELLAERVAAQANAEEANQQDEPIEVDENEVDVPGWEEKRRWLFGLEMASDFLKLLLYIIFFSVSIAFNGLPMHIMRDVYMTFAAFTKRLSDYVNYKKATSDMNSRYPDATTAEIRDDACIVCREDMIAWNDTNVGDEPPVPAAGSRRDEGLRAKKLPCGHILHLRCLKAWLERQQVCPTCRRPVIAALPSTTAAAPNAAQAAPQDAAPRAAPQQPANPNRARFFNLGPLRVGFLNGPPDQMNNIVDQLRGNPPQQAQVAQGGTPITPPNQVPTPTQTRLSQNELSQFAQRIQQEASALNIEQAQLNTLRAMMQELDRLSVVHSQSTNGNTAETVSRPHIAPHMQFTGQHLTGSQSQVMRHDDPNLPSGMTLPEGWTLMPLRQETPRQLPMIHHPAPVMQVNHQAMQAFLPQASRTQRHASPSTSNAAPRLSPRADQTATENNAPDAPESATRPGSIGPVDAQGSPLFVPTATIATPAPAKVEPAEPVADVSTSQQPWSSQDWDFSSQSQSTDEGQEESAEARRNNKGKARAVAMEEVDDPDL